MTSTGGTSTLVVPAPDPRLSPLDQVSGAIFGLIMALTFTGSLSVATADRAEVREMLIGALGCNIAWGLVDAVMYIMAILTERGRDLVTLRDVRGSRDPARARELILDALPPLVASTMESSEVEQIRVRLAALPEPPQGAPRLTFGDLKAAIATFLIVFLSTLPVAIPFLFIQEAQRALRVSNGVALVMLFVGGYILARHSGRRPLLTGLITLAVGVVLVAATIALGG